MMMNSAFLTGVWVPSNTMGCLMVFDSLPMREGANGVDAESSGRVRIFKGCVLVGAYWMVFTRWPALISPLG